MSIRHEAAQGPGAQHAPAPVQVPTGGPGDGRAAGGAGQNAPTLRDLLAGHDREVEEAFRQALTSPTGTQRVRVLHNSLRPSIAVHDAMLSSALCPLLEGLPGGPVVADALRKGCHERTGLLSRFDALSKGVAAQNVYPVSGEQVEEILQGLKASFDEHADVETVQVGGVLEGAAASIDPDVVAARMAIEARRAPLHAHAAVGEHPRSRVRRAMYRFRDEVMDWVDTHHGWAGPGSERPSPRATEVATLEREAAMPGLTVRELLMSHDSLIEGIVAELASAGSDDDRGEAAHRLQAAITVHDLVLGAVLCPLLESVPEGKAAAAQLRRGCQERTELQKAWNALTRHRTPAEAYRTHGEDVTRIMAPLIASFERHQGDESLDAAAVLEALPPDAFRTATSPFADVMWPWHSQGPSLLALRMALSAESSPTRAHPLLTRHPRSRALRTVFRVADHFGDFWRDTGLERWALPKRPPAPFTDDRR